MELLKHSHGKYDPDKCNWYCIKYIIDNDFINNKMNMNIKIIIIK